jgi:hypothetical protein
MRLPPMPHYSGADGAPRVRERSLPAHLHGNDGEPTPKGNKTMKVTNTKLNAPLTDDERRLVAAIRAKGGDVEARIDADGKRWFVAKGKKLIIRATPAAVTIRGEAQP